MWRSGTNIACRKAYVPASTEKVPNTINGCGFVSSETLSAEPVLECVHLSESIICREFRDDCAAEEGAKVNPSNAIHLSEGNDHDQRNVVERNFCAVALQRRSSVDLRLFPPLLLLANSRRAATVQQIDARRPLFPATLVSSDE
nr:uncharacterized protein LOC109161150 [Ipomoea batatas]